MEQESNDFQEPEPRAFNKLNVVLLILVIIAASTLGYMNLIDFFDSENGFKYDTSLTVQSIIPSREAGIINGHEHIQNFAQSNKWLAAMDETGVSTTVMLGSPDATFYIHPTGPFSKYKENNEELFRLVDKYPDRYIAFPTIYTYDDNKLELLKSYIKRGALGLKLFTGHYASFYDALGPLNVSTMYPVFEYCEQEKVPIIWHVHLGQEQLIAEFEEVMSDFPNLIANIPHFMLSSTNLWQTGGEGRLRYFLETYPNLYTDISFGYWAKDGLWRISNHTEVFRDFMIEFQDRFTFGTDMVCTNQIRKDVEWIANLTRGYIDILEKDHFNLTVAQDIEGDFNGDAPGTHNGLNLPKSVLDKIYYDNMVKFLNCRYYYEDLSDVINESKLKYESKNTRSSNQQNELSGILRVAIAVDLQIVKYNDS